MEKYIALIFFYPVLVYGVYFAWDTKEAQLNITELQQEINKHDVRYYRYQKPIISDITYDNLVATLDKLKADYQEYPSKINIADTCKTTISSKKNVSHQKFMGSLLKTELNKVAVFFSKVNDATIIVQPKIDGIAIELIYENGILQQASTRGDGNKGMDITKHVKKMPNIVQLLPISHISEKLILHGELFIRNDLVRDDVLQKYASPRHMIAGLVMRNTIDLEMNKWVDFFPWLWVNSPENKDIDAIHKIYTYGFNLPNLYTDIIEDPSLIENIYQFYQQTSHLPFVADGIVIKIDDYALRANMGATESHPHWAVAVKFPPVEAVTQVIDIEYSIGRTGKITPIIKLSPIVLQKKCVSAISMGSISNINKHDVAMGDLISIKHKGNSSFVFDKVLFRPTTRKQKKFNSAKIYNNATCLNNDRQCKQQFTSRVLWLLSAQCLDMKFIHPNIVNNLIASNTVIRLVDIFKISKEDLHKAGVSDENIAKYLAYKVPSFKLLLKGLSLPYMTNNKLNQLTQVVETPNKLLKIDKLKLSFLLNIDACKAQNIIDYIHKAEIYDVLTSVYQ